MVRIGRGWFCPLCEHFFIAGSGVLFFIVSRLQAQEFTSRFDTPVRCYILVQSTLYIVLLIILSQMNFSSQDCLQNCQWKFTVCIGNQILPIHLILSLHTRYYQEQSTRVRDKETFPKWTKSDHNQFRLNIIYGLAIFYLSLSLPHVMVKWGFTTLITLSSRRSDVRSAFFSGLHFRVPVWWIEEPLTLSNMKSSEVLLRLNSTMGNQQKDFTIRVWCKL